MIDLYYFPTPNTWKVSIMLEECGLPYRVVPVDIMKDAQFQPDFLAISPNGRVPAIVDHEGDRDQSVFESGAILVYLAEKTGRFLPASGPGRVETLEWLFWQMAGLGPMSGQVGYFRRSAPDNSFAIERYMKEVSRLYGVMDRRLVDRKWIAGEYSIADMACWGWVWFHPALGQSLDGFPNLSRWFRAMGQRPAVVKAKTVGVEVLSPETQEMYKGEQFKP
jgi:GST-like protein